MKLKTALSYFSKAELMDFGRVLNSGILGNQESLAACFHACVRLGQENPDWGEMDLALALFPGKGPAKMVKYLRTRTSALLRFVEKYLAWKEFEADEVLQASCLVTALNRRGWKNGYREAYRTAITRIDAAPLKGFGHYAANVRLFETNLEAVGSHSPNRQDLSFQGAMFSLDMAYMTKKFSLSAKAKSQDRLRQTTHQYALLPELEAWVECNNGSIDPLVYLHYQLYQLSVQAGPESDTHYFSAKQLYFSKIDQLLATNRFEAQDQFICLVNYCVLRANMKSKLFIRELVLLYKAGLDAEIGLVDGKIEPHDFINAFSVFLFAEDRQAITWLLDRFEGRILGESALATRHHCLGCLQFWDGKMEAASESFHNALNSPPKQKNPQFEANIRAQLARVSYCLGDYAAAKMHVRSLLIRVKEKVHFHPEKVVSYRQFATIFMDLCRAASTHHSRQQEKCASLRQKIASTQSPFFASKWVSKQLDYIQGI